MWVFNVLTLCHHQDPEFVPVVEEREDFPLFEYVCEVSLRGKGGEYTPYISWGHPPTLIMSEKRELADSSESKQSRVWSFKMYHLGNLSAG